MMVILLTATHRVVILITLITQNNNIKNAKITRNSEGNINEDNYIGKGGGCMSNHGPGIKIKLYQQPFHQSVN